jgi:hypothetical protein
MGFKDLRLFNQALLARQAWRLIAFPDSLCATLLKARYYPRGCLVDTAFPSNSSQTWQSIQYGLDLLKKGIIWRIGRGSQVRIWRDPWIPHDYSFKVTSRKGRCRLKWVSELLDSAGADWDYNKIVGIFNLADVEAILKINLPVRPSEDFLAWAMEKSGLFSVRSAYNLALNLENLEKSWASSRAPNGERKLWKNVWNGNVPPKVNVFTWKLCKDALPTKHGKYKRKMEVEGVCNLCGLATQLAQGPVIIESDCVRVVKAMKEKKDLSDLSFIFAEAFDHAQLLSSWRVVKVNRDFNQVANELAIFARRNSHTAVWVGQAPA